MRHGQLLVDGAAADEVLAVWFAAPNSYTREDVAEIHTHGGAVGPTLALRAALAAGAVPAGPGEFTARAFANGRIDLTQAQGVMELIGAGGLRQARQAMRLLHGEWGQRLESWSQTIVGVRAALEAAMDFPEDDIPTATFAPLDDILQGMRQLLDGQAAAARLRDGPNVVLCGRPNAGKSALLNAFLGYERAIVSPAAGTTRDSLSEGLSVDGALWQLVDTAGLRDSSDPLEQAGVQRTRAAMDAADVIVWVTDGTEDFALQQSEFEDSVSPARARGAAIIIAANKADLPNYVCPPDAIRVSATTGSGLEGLVAALQDILGGGEEAFCLREAHRTALEQAAQSLADALTAPAADAAAADLALAHECLGVLTGRTATPEVIEALFAEFCVGK